MNQDVMVTVNGKAYPTRIYDGVQRFVPDANVKAMVDGMVENFRGPASGGQSQSIWSLIPDELKAKPHANPVVNFLVEKNAHEYFGLNELALALHRGEVELADVIEFETLHGYSVGGFCDSIESKIFNLGLTTVLEDEDGEEYEDSSAHFTISNPLWED